MKHQVNNDYYNHLGESWYEAHDDPVAVLRAEQKLTGPWIEERIVKHFNSSDLTIVDVGCGGGFLANRLSLKFDNVSGVDASESSLEVARANDKSSKVNYVVGDSYELPFDDESCDVVCAIDFLEHVENPALVVQECSRILKPGGLFFFLTFNRNWFSWLVAIKFMEWFVPNTPKHLHVLHLFIKPAELDEMMKQCSMSSQEWVGIGPKMNFEFFKSILVRRVTEDFTFKTSKHLKLAYMGYAIKKHSKLSKS